MKRPLAIVLALAVCSPATAGSFGIDFSPLSAPGFGKRRDYSVDTVVDNGGNSSRPARPPRPSPEMRELGRDLDNAEARLADEIIEIPNLERPSVGFSYQSATTQLGDTLFNVRQRDEVARIANLPAAVALSSDERRRRELPSQALGIAAALMQAATQAEGCAEADGIDAQGPSNVYTCENSAFVADQAARAMFGDTSLRVAVGGNPPRVTEQERQSVEAAMFEVELAAGILELVQESRLRAERVLRDLRLEVWENPPERAAYLEAVRNEQRILERLRNAQATLRDAMVRAGTAN
jgi:hypothetical protein